MYPSIGTEGLGILLVVVDERMGDIAAPVDVLDNPVPDMGTNC